MTDDNRTCRLMNPADGKELRYVFHDWRHDRDKYIWLIEMVDSNNVVHAWVMRDPEGTIQMSCRADTPGTHSDESGRRPVLE